MERTLALGFGLFGQMQVPANPYSFPVTQGVRKLPTRLVTNKTRVSSVSLQMGGLDWWWLRVGPQGSSTRTKGSNPQTTNPNHQSGGKLHFSLGTTKACEVRRSGCRDGSRVPPLETNERACVGFLFGF